VGRHLSLLAALAALSGCTTTILAQQPGARIYVDGELMGVNEASISRVGMPHTFEIRVDYGETQVVTTVEREFTGTTILLGLVSLYTGLLWGWTLPEEIELAGPPETGNPWQRNAPTENPWLRPRAGG